MTRTQTASEQVARSGTQTAEAPTGAMHDVADGLGRTA